MSDSRSLIVAMEGISNILSCGEKHFRNSDGENQFAIELELCGGVDGIEALQMHKNH